jgi:hypothetical protein
VDEPYTVTVRCATHPQEVRSLTVYVGDEAPPHCRYCNKPMLEPAHGIHNLVTE